jgi:low affinity Fe/Cu permease
MSSAPAESPIEHAFTWAASRISRFAGSPTAFGGALALIVGWAVIGPFVGYSELWQLAVNTGTTIVTFLMVFIIQNSQNRDTAAIQVKIDELIRATKGASNSLMDIEILSATEIEALHKRYCDIAERAKALGYAFDRGSPDLPPVPIAEAERAASKSEKRRAAAANGTRNRPKRRRTAKPARTSPG